MAWSEILAPNFAVFTPAVEHGDFRCRSVVGVRRSLSLFSEPFPVPTVDYHGSYVAAASVVLPKLGRTVLVSAHASPTRPTEEQRSKWHDVPAPQARSDGDLWDSDYVFATLESVAKNEQVLVAGDLNEARAWDDLHPGTTWGADYFALAGHAGFCDVTFRLWNHECVTHGAYQLDHVLATNDVARQITDARVVDLDDADEADHCPIRFTISLDEAS